MKVSASSLYFVCKQRWGTLHDCSSVSKMSSCAYTGHSHIEGNNFLILSIVHKQTVHCIFSVVYQSWHCLHKVHAQRVCLTEVSVLWRPAHANQSRSYQREASAKLVKNNNIPQRWFWLARAFVYCCTVDSILLAAVEQRMPDAMTKHHPTVSPWTVTYNSTTGLDIGVRAVRCWTIPVTLQHSCPNTCSSL